MATWRKLWKKALLNETVRRRGAKALGVLAYVLLMADDDGTSSVSVRQLAADLSLTHKEARGIIAAFAAAGTLDVSGGTDGTVIRFDKWAQYAEGTQRAHKRAHKGHTEGHTEGHTKGTRKGTQKEESSTPNSRNSSELATTEKTASRARVKEADIYKYYTTPYARAREETPVEKLEKEDREEAARLMETIRYPTKWEEVRDAAVAYAISMDEEEADCFIAKYAAVGWIKAGAKIRDWRYLLRSWHRNWQQVEKDKEKKKQGRTKNARNDFGQADFSGNYGPPTEYADF